MTETRITKRVHISGLTSSITHNDLVGRLASFGTVTALDGLGARDALGRPRPFAYATLHTTPAQLARCNRILFYLVAPFEEANISRYDRS